MVKTASKINNIGLSQEKSEQGDEGFTFLKIPLKFLDLPLYTKKFQRKQAFIRGNSTKLCDTP